MTDLAAAWAALREAEQRASEADPAAARAACDRALAILGSDPAPAVRAVEVLLRALADLEQEPDVAAIRGVLGTLLAHGQWEAATTAHATLADHAARRGAFDEARACYAVAIGCAEAGGGRWIPSNLLRKLALAEIRAGNAAHAVDHLARALEKLKGVALLNARLVEAECMEALGDAHSALGDRAAADVHWRDAIARQEGLERGPAAAKIRAKLSAS